MTLISSIIEALLSLIFRSPILGFFIILMIVGFFLPDEITPAQNRSYDDDECESTDDDSFAAISTVSAFAVDTYVSDWRQEMYMDASGAWRSPGDSYIDYSGQWRTPGDWYVDYSGTWRSPTDRYIDASGAWRTPGEAYIDYSGNWRR